LLLSQNLQKITNFEIPSPVSLKNMNFDEQKQYYSIL
jgi:hypothetical protein